MLNYLKNENNYTYTENGGTAYSSTNSFCLDMFFKAGAMRNSTAEEIADVVTRAYAEDPDKTMKIVFFARDARGGLGERRFFRCAVSALVKTAPKAVEKNIPMFAEYGRYDDLCVLLGTPLENAAAKEIRTQLDKDITAMKRNGQVSLLAKWLPSVNASSQDTRNKGRRMAALLGMSEPAYRRTLSALRAYTDILENRLRERDYTFDYEAQPSCAMFKYRKENIDTNTPQVRFVLSIFAALSELEREQTLQRQREGITVAKSQGKYKGRQPIDIDWAKFGQLYEQWKSGTITAVWFQKEMGLRANTFYRRLREYERGI